MATAAQFQAGGGAIGSLFGALGDFMSIQGYEDAADLAKKQAKYQKISTSIQEMQQTRKNYQIIGGQKADYAASGISSATAGALDVLRSSAEQGSMAKSVIGMQGYLQELEYKAQAEAYEQQAQAALISGIGNLYNFNQEAAAAILAGGGGG